MWERGKKKVQVRFVLICYSPGGRQLKKNICHTHIRRRDLTDEKTRDAAVRFRRAESTSNRCVANHRHTESVAKTDKLTGFQGLGMKFPSREIVITVDHLSIRNKLWILKNPGFVDF